MSDDRFVPTFDVLLDAALEAIENDATGVWSGDIDEDRPPSGAHIRIYEILCDMCGAPVDELSAAMFAGLCSAACALAALRWGRPR